MHLIIIKLCTMYTMILNKSYFKTDNDGKNVFLTKKCQKSVTMFKIVMPLTNELRIARQKVLKKTL